MNQGWGQKQAPRQDSGGLKKDTLLKVDFEAPHGFNVENVAKGDNQHITDRMRKSQQENNIFSDALEYGKAGFKIFPTKNKKPMIKDWPNMATDDPAKIKEYFSMPGVDGIGLPTGKINDIEVIDFDNKDIPIDALIEIIQDNHGPLNETLISETKNGGRHFIYKYSGNLKTGSKIFGPELSIDGRGDGGYINGPWSVGYHALDIENISDFRKAISPAPAWLKNINKPKKEKEKTENTEGPIFEGSRNSRLTSEAGRLRRINFNYDDILLYVKSFNQARCNPPLPEKDIETIVKSVCRYEPENKIDDFSDLIYRANELSENYNPTPQIIQKILNESSFNLAVGPTNTAKTFSAIAMGGAISRGSDFFGYKTKKRTVLLISAEAAEGNKKRLIAYEKYYNVTLDNFYMLPYPVNMRESQVDTDKIISALEKLNINPGFIIIDNAAAVMHGGNENGGEDWAPLIDNAEKLQRTTGAAILLIHHMGKDTTKGSRGWSGLVASIDTEFQLSKSGNIFTLKITKQRDLPTKDSELHFSLEVIETGFFDNFGEAETTCVAIPTDAKPKKQNDKIADNIETILGAWGFTDNECDDQDRPYISKSGLLRYLTDMEGKTKTTAGKYIQLANNRGVIKPLIDEKYIISYDNGFSVIDNELQQKFSLISKVKK